MAVINLFGNSEAGLRMQQVLVANAPLVVNQQISPAAEYVGYDRTAGNVEVMLPLISSTIEAAFRSGNQLTPNFMFADVTPAASLNTIIINANVGDNICGAPYISNAFAGYRVFIMATPTGWLALECPYNPI